MISETSADLLASDDKTLTDVNIVNHNVSTGATTFEYFDKYSYEARNESSSNSIDDSSLNTSSGSAVGEANVPDFDIHHLGDTDMYYVNGYTPLNSVSLEEIKDNEAERPDGTYARVESEGGEKIDSQDYFLKHV